ncbi:hypothetical protein CFR01_004406 [Escherichia coli]|nr:hypothetical protein [Escherichia coli]HBA6980183.1 hypothetical protein [Escherichia coli]HBA7447925.1 hypothetical protein [Escherichia coli]HBA8266264.1 hypothetical protein [Escherichia coli]HBA8386410.1 hypothetical protein [Escherichia coli]
MRGRQSRYVPGGESFAEIACQTCLFTEGPGALHGSKREHEKPWGSSYAAIVDNVPLL